MAPHLSARLHWQAKGLHTIPLLWIGYLYTAYWSACLRPARLLLHADEINLPELVFVMPAQPHR